ncbi:MAG: type VI secretion system secreted protein VgrG [Sulfitobacter sp.]|jgi:type VI secretion system secreted protein VgrG
MLKNFDPAKFPLRLEGEVKDKKLLPLMARVEESIGTIPTVTVDLYCENAKLALNDIVGKSMHLVAADDEGSNKRWFRGTCISAEFIAKLDVGGHFRVEIRPWLWFLRRRTDLRVYQNKTVVEIITAVIEEYGFSGHISNKLSHSFEAREYCTQYRETDFDFISRLMQEEGIYYFFDHTGDTEKLVLADAASAHKPVTKPNKLRFLPYALKSTLETSEPVVFEWSPVETLRSGKVTLNDFDFENTTADLVAESAKSGVSYIKSDHERYDYPGHYRKAGLGEHFAKVRMEGEAVKHQMLEGVSDAVNLAVGHTFSIDQSPRPNDPVEVMLVACDHRLVQVGARDEKMFAPVFDASGVEDNATDHKEVHQVRFKAIDSAMQFRSSPTTPWPNIGGIHTAIVTGPKGEEIWTDKFGRIRIQFHWDRDGKMDDKSSCWVRAMMPWTGKRWGAIAIPRIGQEVVIQFEEGDPDRPLCIGMLYNDKTMPPYSLPDNKTQSGVKTNSSLKGGGFNELMFEDKKDDELVRFQSEKNYEQIVKNDASIKIGLDKKDKGDLDVVVHNDVSETINEGNYTETIKKGNHKTTLNKGNHDTLLKLGDMTVDAKAGKITVTAMKSIEFKVGGSSIKMDPMSITLKSPTITVKADMKADVASPMTTVKGEAMLTLKGGIVFIN